MSDHDKPRKLGPSPSESEKPHPAPTLRPAPLLQDELDEITQRTRTLVQPERLIPNERAVAELLALGMEDHILPVGAKAPAFALPTIAGRIVRSTDLLALGPLVVNFFRGRWCPLLRQRTRSMAAHVPAGA